MYIQAMDRHYRPETAGAGHYRLAVKPGVHGDEILQVLEHVQPGSFTGIEIGANLRVDFRPWAADIRLEIAAQGREFLIERFAVVGPFRFGVRIDIALVIEATRAQGEGGIEVGQPGAPARPFDDDLGHVRTHMRTT
jgi:hypothetical protein